MRYVAIAITLAVLGTTLVAQEDPLSPVGTAAARVSGKSARPAGRVAPALGGEN
jgi:hypothetical protein